MHGGGPVGEDLPEERTLASFHGDEVRLTDRRVVYQGQGLRRHESMSVHLEDVTAAGVGRRLGLNPYVAGLPLSLFAFGVILTALTGDDDPVFFGFFGALFTLPAAFFAPVHAIRIVTTGGGIAVRVPRRLLDEAKAFVHQVERVRAERRSDAPRPEAPTPTVQPYLA